MIGLRLLEKYFEHYGVPFSNQSPSMEINKYMLVEIVQPMTTEAEAVKFFKLFGIRHVSSGLRHGAPRLMTPSSN